MKKSLKNILGTGLVLLALNSPTYSNIQEFNQPQEKILAQNNENRPSYYKSFLKWYIPLGGTAVLLSFTRAYLSYLSLRKNPKGKRES